MTAPTDQTTLTEQTNTESTDAPTLCGKLVRIDGLGHYHWCVDNAGHWGGCEDDRGHAGTPTNLRDACAKLLRSYETTLETLSSLMREYRFLEASHSTQPQSEAWTRAKRLLEEAGKPLP